MTKTIVMITHPPFGHENAFAGLYVASAALSKGLEITVAMTGDGVYAGRKGQIDPLANINMPSTEDQVRDIIDLGGRLIVDQDSMLERGITQEELIEGVELQPLEKIHDLMLDDGEIIVTF
jgi:predicted peroxiredoxin